MRLIDADKLKEEMNGKFHKIKHTSPDFLAEGFVQIDMLIDDQPTAYDIDKVVEQLEEEINKGFYDDEYGIYCCSIDIVKAIEIVKGGQNE